MSEDQLKAVADLPKTSRENETLTSNLVYFAITTVHYSLSAATFHLVYCVNTQLISRVLSSDWTRKFNNKGCLNIAFIKIKSLTSFYPYKGLSLCEFIKSKMVLCFKPQPHSLHYFDFLVWTMICVTLLGGRSPSRVCTQLQSGHCHSLTAHHYDFAADSYCEF